jgi:hypothetical protein
MRSCNFVPHRRSGITFLLLVDRGEDQGLGSITCTFGVMYTRIEEIRISGSK